MSRPATGQVIERDGKDGKVWAIRFRAGGERRYMRLGGRPTWNRQRAEDELANQLAAARLGIWKPPQPAPVIDEPHEEQTFWEFAREWLQARTAEGLAAKTVTDFEWSLNRHLIYFGHHRLSEITVREVDHYKVAKTRERAEVDAAREIARARGERFNERGLSNGSINHTLRHLSQILETAAEYGLIASNPATGKRRRLKSAPPARPWVEPEQLMALLEAATGVGRILLAILAGGGLRIGEALALRWSDVDLGTGTLYVRDAKTLKGIREVHLTPALREELTLWRADASYAEATDFVIHTSTRHTHNPSNLRRDVLVPAIATANATLAEAGIAPLSAITFHSLRRTYASLRCVCGDDIRYTADQLGHEDPRFTLRAYAQASKRRDRLSRPQLEAFERALDWASMSTVLDVPATAALIGPGRE